MNFVKIKNYGVVGQNAFTWLHRFLKRVHTRLKQAVLLSSHSFAFRLFFELAWLRGSTSLKRLSGHMYVIRIQNTLVAREMGSFKSARLSHRRFVLKIILSAFTA